MRSCFRGSIRDITEGLVLPHGVRRSVTGLDTQDIDGWIRASNSRRRHHHRIRLQGGHADASMMLLELELELGARAKNNIHIIVAAGKPASLSSQQKVEITDDKTFNTYNEKK